MSDELVFEDEVRRVATAIWGVQDSLVPSIEDGRERDGVTITDDLIHIVEATVSRRKDKVESDISKSVSLMRSLKERYPDKIFRIWIITAASPTAEQFEIVKKYRGKYKCSINIEGFAAFSSKVVDGRGYLERRANHFFGSIRDPHEETKFNLPEDEFIPIDFVEVRTGLPVLFDFVKNQIQKSDNDPVKILMLGDYGSGKSMTLRNLYNERRMMYLQGGCIRFPIFINLREHFGQSNPAEAIMRHATNIGFGKPMDLIAGWKAGFCDIFLDGFDELSSARLVRSTQGLKRARREAVALVRNFVSQTTINSSIIITGRENYFDSKDEMLSAFGLSEDIKILSVSQFNEEQISNYLQKKGVAAHIPDWLPSRPLLLGYLAVRGLIETKIDQNKITTMEDLSKEEGWDYLIDRVCQREAEQIDPVSIDPSSVREFLERLSTRARSTISGRGPLNVRDMDDLYQSVFGDRPDEKAEIFLLRLPGFTATLDVQDSREFIDDDFVDACRAGDVVRYVRDPFNFDSSVFRDVGLEVGELGVGVAARNCLNLTQKQISNALDNSIDNLGNPVLSFDIFMISSYLGKRLLDPLKQIREGIFKQINIESGFIYGKIEFIDCVFETVGADCRSGFKSDLKFRGCSIFNLIGPSSVQDWESSFDIENCEVDRIENEAGTNNDILQLDLPMGVRVLLTILRKLFVQKGSGRRESALFRGMDQRARGYVGDVLSLVERHEFAKPYSHVGPKVWIANRSKTNAVAVILQKPAASRAVIVEEARLL